MASLGLSRTASQIVLLGLFPLVRAIGKEVGGAEIGRHIRSPIRLRDALVGIDGLVEASHVEMVGRELLFGSGDLRWREFRRPLEGREGILVPTLNHEEGAEGVPGGPVVRVQGGGRSVGALGFVEIPDPFIASRQLPVGLVGSRVTSQNILEFFDGGVLPAGGSVDARQRHLGGGHFRIDPAGGLGFALRLGQRFPIAVSIVDLPQRFAETDVGEDEIRRDPEGLAEILGGGIRAAGVVRGVEKALAGDVVVVGGVRPIGILAPCGVDRSSVSGIDR